MTDQQPSTETSAGSHPRTYSLVGSPDLFLVTDDESGIIIGYANKIGGPLTARCGSFHVPVTARSAYGRKAEARAVPLDVEALLEDADNLIRTYAPEGSRLRERWLADYAAWTRAIEAEAAAPAAPGLDETWLALAMSHHSDKIGFNHSTDSCGTGCAKAVAAEYAAILTASEGGE